MKGAILYKGKIGHTNLGRIFNAINNEQLKYNWLVTCCECYFTDNEVNNFLEQDYVWISGEDLTKIIEKEDAQFVWGIFSAFSKGVTLAEVLKHELPNSENPSYMQNHVPIQHPLAEIEIGAFDSTFTTLICRDDRLTNMFLAYFPLAKDLDEMNTQDNIAISRVERLLNQELERRQLKATKELLYGKYNCWQRLGEERKNTASDEEIIEQISKYLEDMKPD